MLLQGEMRLLLKNENSQLADLGAAVSRLIGWIYFVAWSISFYPQLIKTYRRRSVTGLSVDFFTINVFGFLTYTLSSGLLLWSPRVREEYASHHPSAPIPSVRYNDFAFGMHALLLAFLMWLQLWAFGYTRETSQKLSWGMLGVILGSILTVLSFSALAFINVGGVEALDVVYALSYVKILISLLKYIPQVLLNYQRKSTVGWSIENILCDATGGAFSLMQLVLDSAIAGDVWAGTFGNPLKFWLGVVSLFFDGIFLAQHYWWFRGNKHFPFKDIETDQTSAAQGNRTLGRDYGSISQPDSIEPVTAPLLSESSSAPARS